MTQKYVVTTLEGRTVSQYAGEQELFEDPLAGVVWLAEDPTRPVDPSNFAQELWEQEYRDHDIWPMFTPADVSKAWRLGLIELADEWRGGYTTVYLNNIPG